jgi:hypothetical protein
MSGCLTSPLPAEYAPRHPEPPPQVLEDAALVIAATISRYGSPGDDGELSFCLRKLVHDGPDHGERNRYRWAAAKLLTAGLLGLGDVEWWGPDDVEVTSTPGLWDRWRAGRMFPESPAPAGSAPARYSAAALSTATPPSEADQYVSRDQAAGLLKIAKKTLERAMNLPGSGAPVPDKEGGGGYAHKWKWSRLRPWLEQYFGLELSDRFPG